MRPGQSKGRYRGASLLAALLVLVGGCSGNDTAESTPPDTTTSTPAIEPSTTAPSTTTPPTTTIPTTSVPPRTVPPPELGATTTTSNPVATTLPEVDDTTVVVSPEDDLAALVDQSPAGTQFLLLPGVHRTGRSEPKDGMTFEGTEGTILNGSVFLEDFTPVDQTWETNGPRLNMDGHGECVDGYQACSLRNDLFIDDAMLWRVDNRTEVAPGTWWSNGNTIVIGDDPAGRKVEVSLTENAFRSDAADVTIRNMIIEKYATMAQRGAIQSEVFPQRLGTGWLIENVEVKLNHGTGIRAGNQTTIRNAHVHHNGQQGITSDGGEGILVESSEIDHNNLRGFSWGWEAGGAKFKKTVGLVVRDVISHHNLGPGLWTDIDNYDTTYENNVVYSNNAPGIFHEISFDAIIRNNEVYNNGFIMGDWLWGAGILVAASSNVDVYDNVVTNNADGITGIQQRRESDGELRRLENIRVYDNTITMWYGQSGVAQDIGDASVFTDRNIVFGSNTYVGAGHEAFAWDGDDLTFDEWLRTGQGAGSTRSDG